VAASAGLIPLPVVDFAAITIPVVWHGDVLAGDSGAGGSNHLRHRQGIRPPSVERRQPSHLRLNEDEGFMKKAMEEGKKRMPHWGNAASAASPDPAPSV
jgi:hypothetical protein